MLLREHSWGIVDELRMQIPCKSLKYNEEKMF